MREVPRNGGTMTLRTYRISGSGERTELARLEVYPGESYWSGPISGEWPPCTCPRCAPMHRSRLRRAGLAPGRRS
ncbi:hypothetical protein OG455_30295 [Kitasatospora sp. NBC_01287]|uniref:hypothetical protein n=1 Tax=Kitasatospora sp. NBC_01287 TaxID=2903573 RepID=UPI00225A8164|nr:hypothetical protein [Kitasatospora sp. NBC_01287]MCX4749754.1 hypothetical protein [Kitasatospora sp. NBC_01287]